MSVTMPDRIIVTLQEYVDASPELHEELLKCILLASWTPPGWHQPISTCNDFYLYLNQLLNTVPVDATFDNLFHGLYYIASQDDNALQQDPAYKGFQTWMELFVEIYGSYMNTAKSANNLFSFMHDKTFRIQDFEITPGGFCNFNTFFSRHIKPGLRPIGTRTQPFQEPSEGNPLPPTEPEDPNLIYSNMCNDKVITVPADSVYKGQWPITPNSTIKVSKGNTYSIKELLEGSAYADRFSNGIFTHSYLTVYTYHRYHVPVRGTVLETKVITGDVYANVEMKENGDLSATDGTGYQFRQDRGLIVLDSPVGLVALLPIGMDFISSCNISATTGTYLNKGDEFGYFLFGGSDMIMLFENPYINIQLPEEDMLYKLGQVFARLD